MNPLVLSLLLTLCVLASAIYSGSEIGMYSLSRTRLDIEARQGSWSARVTRRLVSSDTALLITILIGNNVAMELSTHVAGELLPKRAGSGFERELYVALFLTPILFFFGEALPKDLFRQRPHRLVALSAPLLVLSRVLFWPLERLMRGLSFLLERTFGLESEGVARNPGRESVLTFLAEGKRSGVLPEHAEVLAHNALKLRSIPISRAMRPWSDVKVVNLAGDEDPYSRVARSNFSRLPVLTADGSVAGYLHQLDVLARGPGEAILESLRPLPALPAETPVDRALARLRVSGQRVAVVGSADQPVGIVTLKDLLEEISGDLAAW